MGKFWRRFLAGIRLGLFASIFFLTAHAFTTPAQANCALYLPTGYQTSEHFEKLILTRNFLDEVVSGLVFHPKDRRLTKISDDAEARLQIQTGGKPQDASEEIYYMLKLNSQAPSVSEDHYEFKLIDLDDPKNTEVVDLGPSESPYWDYVPVSKFPNGFKLILLPPQYFGDMLRVYSFFGSDVSPEDGRKAILAAWPYDNHQLHEVTMPSDPNVKIISFRRGIYRNFLNTSNGRYYIVASGGLQEVDAAKYYMTFIRDLQQFAPMSEAVRNYLHGRGSH